MIDTTVLGVLIRFAFLGLFVFRVLKWVKKNGSSLTLNICYVTYSI